MDMRKKYLVQVYNAVGKGKERRILQSIQSNIILVTQKTLKEARDYFEDRLINIKRI